MKQKLNKIEGMTEIRSGLTEEESGSDGGREMTSVSESRGTGGRTEGMGGENETRRDGKGGYEQRQEGLDNLCHRGQSVTVS